jgi:hypothetical protein
MLVREPPFLTYFIDKHIIKVDQTLNARRLTGIHNLSSSIITYLQIQFQVASVDAEVTRAPNFTTIRYLTETNQPLYMKQQKCVVSWYKKNVN